MQERMSSRAADPAAPAPDLSSGPDPATATPPAYAFGGTMKPGTRGGKSQIAGAGLLNSDVAGRTDHLNVSAPAGSYVIPADVVSGLGEGNTMHGAKVIDEMFSTGPWGIDLPRGGGGSTMPRRARGGSVKREDRTPVEILAAGGEYVMPAGWVKRIGGGDTKRGHDTLDRWVVKERRRIIAEMKKLRGPRKD
jgi:hypothetical protein